MQQTKKGFTLIELLVVIAILAVLATAVVVILNPAQLVKQGRDSTRISDLAALHSAVALYLSDVASTDLDSALTVCSNTDGAASTNVLCTAAGTSPLTNTTCTVNTSTAVSGTGWVPVNFNNISSGSPLSRLPVDPVNDTTNFYAYGCNNYNKTFEIDARMESTKYGPTGGNTSVTVNSKDGGNNDNWYEIGNDPALDL